MSMDTCSETEFVQSLTAQNNFTFQHCDGKFNFLSEN